MNASTLPLPLGGEVGEVSPVRLLDELHRRGAIVEARGDNLAIDAPRGAIADLLPDLAKFKPALLELLRQPDARQLAHEVTAARRGAWLTPQPSLLTVWRQLNAHFAANLTSQQIGAIARLIEANPQLDNDELLVQIGALLRQGENHT